MPPRTFRWSLQLQILATLLGVLAAGMLFSMWITDNLFVGAVDRQLNSRLFLVAELARLQLPVDRIGAYLPGDQTTRIFTGHQRQVLDFIHDHALARATFLSAEGRVRLDTGDLAPGTVWAVDPTRPMDNEPAPLLLHHTAQGHWEKIMFYPLPQGNRLRLAEGPEMLALLDQVQARRWLALGLGALVAVGLSWILARLLGRRLAQLTAAFRRLQAGARHQPVLLPGRDEIAYLALAFNDMAGELAARAERERREHERRVTELKILAGGVAHEIRNPLAAIASLSDMLGRADAVRGTADAQDLVDRLQKEVERMDKIVRDVLAYARQPKLNCRPVNVNALLAEAAQTDPGCRLETPPALPEACLDPVGLLTVLRNLILNARDACGPTGDICVGARCRKRRMLLYVSDNGPGIPPEQVKLIFQPFYSNKPRGSGLGLAIARTIIEAHGGRLRLARWSPGALFVAALPVTPGGKI